MRTPRLAFTAQILVVVVVCLFVLVVVVGFLFFVLFGAEIFIFGLL